LKVEGPQPETRLSYSPPRVHRVSRNPRRTSPGVLTRRLRGGEEADDNSLI